MTVASEAFKKIDAPFWFLMAFIAGAVNVGGFMACLRFVTHVTGFATLFGADIVSNQWLRGFSMLSVPIFFLFGVMFSAYFVDHQSLRNRRPQYSLVLGLIALCLFLAAFGGQLNWFGPFGHDVTLDRDYVFLILLCGASGMQNALVSTVSGSLVRTTHLTGLTTDLGIGFMRIFMGHVAKQKELYLIRLRLGSIFSFIAGSALGALAFSYFDYLGFLMPGFLAVLAAVIAHRY